MSVFFILSGFLLAYRHAEDSGGTKQYLINRVARIYPVYIVAAVLTVPWMGLGFDVSGGYQLLVSALKLIALVLANIFLVQAWYPGTFYLWNDSASWSISVEAFCYLALPFLLPWLRGLSIKNLLVVFVCCYVMAVIPGLYARGLTLSYFPFIYALPLFRLPEFLMGVCALLAMRKGVRLAYSSFVAPGAILIFVVYLGLYGSDAPMYVGHNWAVLPLITVLIFSLVEAKGVVGWILSSRVLVWLGKISYCFYSFQVLILFLLVQYHEPIVKLFPYFGNAWILGGAAFLALMFLSVIGHYFIEEPFRKLIISRFSNEMRSGSSIKNLAVNR